MAEEPESKGTDKEPESKTDEPDFKAEAEKWKAMSRKHEADAKKNADAAKRLAELEEEDKTEQQKLTDAKLAAEKKAEEAELRALRYEVAAEKGLSPKLAARLSGSDREELLADADELLVLMGSDKDPEVKKPPSRTPKEKLKSGSEPEKDPEPDPLKLAESIGRVNG